MIYKCYATSVMGLESIVGDELKSLGLENIKVENARVYFDADLENITRANLWLRSAERVFIEVGKFQAKTFTQLFDGIEALPWEVFLQENSSFPVDAKSVKSELFSLSDIQKIAKRAIVKKMTKLYKKEWFDEKGPKHQIQISILKNEVTVSIDTSGVGLHKRGYRMYGNEAPIKETLASGIILVSKWRPQIHLIDPMCGSGTILIEAAMMKKNIAPGIQRSFSHCDWERYPNGLFKTLVSAAKKSIISDKELDGIGSIEGYDIDNSSLKQARINAKKAGVENIIHFQNRDIRDFSTSKKYGYIISNPPYGERLSDLEKVSELTREFGKVLSNYDDWSKYFFTAHENFEKDYGSVATKNRKLYNARLKAYLYQYFGKKPPRLSDNNSFSKKNDVQDCTNRDKEKKYKKVINVRNPDSANFRENLAKAQNGKNVENMSNTDSGKK